MVVPCSNSISSLSPPTTVTKGPRRATEPTRKRTSMGGDIDVMKGNALKDCETVQSSSLSESPLSQFGEIRPPLELALETCREPTRHPNTNRKIASWIIKVKKPIIILGDSNLSRIPVFRDSKVQVDSYPGATFNHIREVLCRTTPFPRVEKVILSLGLNNCLKRQTESTTWKQLQQLLKTCEVVFPKAEIFVPIINYSERLPRDQQNLIEKLNRTIQTKCPFLSDINRLLFRTTSQDPVHWTEETAQAILNHWLDQLNM